MSITGEFSRYIAYVKIDQKGIVTTCSKAFLERFSLSMDELRDRPVCKVLASEALEQALMVHRKKEEEAAGLVQSESLLPIIGKNKGMIWCIVEIVSKNGEEILYFHDRTESYQAQMILESVMMLESDPFLFFDTQGCVLQCSEEAVRIFGFPNRLETFGLHYTTFFHNRVQEGILKEMFHTLEQGMCYESTASVRYKGEMKQYEIRAFNVMMKNKKAGMAVCLTEASETELYVAGQEVSVLRGGMTPYLSQSVEDQFEPYREMELSEVRESLYTCLCGYEYNSSLYMIEYLLRYGEEERKEEYLKVKGYLDAFCYEQAAEVLKASSLERGEA